MAPLPPFIQQLIGILVHRGVIGADQTPNSAAVNVFNAGDCMPPVLEHHDFERPIFVVSLQSQQPIVFGQKIRTPKAGQFSGDFELMLPRRSVLMLEGHSADVTKHAMPCVSAQRVEIVLRCARAKAGARGLSGPPRRGPRGGMKHPPSS